MPIEIVRNDITKMKVDAIVNAANESLLGGGGVDGCIHKAAGSGLLAECAKLGGCKTGSAKLTAAYNLPCKYVIHAVGPRWHGGKHGEKELLESCYRTAMELALCHGCKTVAFPLISSGIYGYPKDEALRVATDTISGFLSGVSDDVTVYIVIFDRAAYDIGRSLYSDICSYIDDNYAQATANQYARRDSSESPNEVCAEYSAAPVKPSHSGGKPQKTCRSAAVSASLMKAVSELDESFSEMLLRKIDESGMTDAECYKRANIDRKLFSKIRSDALYKPSKKTALAFAIALRLPLGETNELLRKAGFALSHASRADVIVEYFIINNNYDIFEINSALFAFDEMLLGASAN